MSSKKTWWNNGEKAGFFWLRLSFLLVRILPNFIIKFITIFISFFYFIFVKQARVGIYKFYDNLWEFKHKSKISFIKKIFFSYLNFFEFSVALGDKIAVWCGKFSFNRLKIKNENYLINALKDQQKGKILLSYHFGNTEIARAFENKLGKSKIYILMYGKNSQKFVDFMNETSKEKINIIFIEELGIEQILELEKLINSGFHIALMSDRVGVNGGKNEIFNFLGKDCAFPAGGFYLSHILNAEILCFVCLRNGSNYDLEAHELKSDKVNKKEKIFDLQEKYVRILENYASNKPKFWFNFYDFWGEYAK